MRNQFFKYCLPLILGIFVTTLAYALDRGGARQSHGDGNRQGQSNWQGKSRMQGQNRQNHPNQQFNRNSNNNHLKANSNRQVNPNWNNNNLQNYPNRQVNGNWNNNNVNVNNNDVNVNKETNANVVRYGTGSAVVAPVYGTPAYYGTTYTTGYTHCAWVDAHYDDYGNWIPAHQQCW